MTETERRRLIVLRFVTSAVRGDVFDFVHSTTEIDWPGAFLEIFEELAQFPREAVGDDVRRAFLWSWRAERDQGGSWDQVPVGAAWTMTGDLEGHTDLLVRALKILMLKPAIQPDPAMLFRGQSLEEHQRGRNGVWWTTSPSYAETFARRLFRAHAGQGAILATAKPKEAIICQLGHSEFLLDPAKLGEVRLIDTPPRYTPEQDALDFDGRQALSRLQGVPPGDDQSAIAEWISSGMKAEGLAQYREFRRNPMSELEYARFVADCLAATEPEALAARRNSRRLSRPSLPVPQSLSPQ